MKKHFVTLIFLTLLAPCVWAQTFQRTTKSPNFFIPKGALQTGNRTEKLVPIEAMRYQGQQAPVIIEMQKQQAQAKVQKEAAEKARLAIKEQNKANNKIAEKKQQELSQLSYEQEQIQEKNPDISFEKNKISAQQAARLKAQRIKEQHLKSQKQKPEENQFDKIIAEYRQDVKDISANKAVRNQRLINMIADYKDFEHSI